MNRHVPIGSDFFQRLTQIMDTETSRKITFVSQYHAFDDKVLAPA
jgi:hypothetical protein